MAASLRSADPATWATVALYTMIGGFIGALAAAIPGLIDLLSLTDLTTGEVVGRLGKDWSKGVRSYEGHAHMLMFADTLTVGIAKQFPDKVRMAQQ